MEIVLAIVVVAAVIFFGALISAGNERQRKAIDNLREQTALWAMQDLQIKRERLTRVVHVDDPLGWLNKIVTKACGYDINLQVVEVFDQPRALFCESRNGGGKVIFSPLSPVDIRHIKRGKINRLSQFAGRNPLLFLPRGLSIHELSVLNVGPMFDLELSLVWKELTGQNLELSNRLWIYEYS